MASIMKLRQRRKLASMRSEVSNGTRAATGWFISLHLSFIVEFICAA
jgi:hypothetical protein